MVVKGSIIIVVNKYCSILISNYSKFLINHFFNIGLTLALKFVQVTIAVSISRIDHPRNTFSSMNILTACTLST